ncbi:MAG: hypothetical protein HeimC2_23400 [Candidatus Heimdallarchaeota archaeon LC_2]|nr:MAG: hypothetical protein HeimC2_23400 [Candidatus Heimdallarchaeota archaeon LC_2]
MYSWEFDKAYAIINSWNETKKLDALLLKATLLNHQGEFEQALETINSEINMSLSENNSVLEFNGIAIKCNILMKLGRMQEVTDLFNKWESKIQKFDAHLLQNSKWSRSYFYHYHAVFKMLNGDKINPLKIFQKAINLRTEIDDKYGLASTVQNIGFFYNTIGNFDEAMVYLNKAREYYKNLKYPYGIAIVLADIGDIYRLQGKLIDAKDHLLKAIDIFGQIKGNPNPHVIAFTYRKMGRIHMLLNDFDHARWNFNAALETLEEGSLPITFVELSFDNILLAIEEGNSEEENKWVEKLREIQKNNSDNKIIDLHLKFVEALILLKSTGRLKGVAEAEKIFEEIINADIISHEITVLAMIQYLGVLFMEMRVIQSQEILEEIMFYSRKIFEIAIDQQSVALMIELHILNAKIALLTVNTKEIFEQLDLGLKLATNYDIAILQDKVNNEKKYATDHIKRYNSMSETERSIISRLDDANILSYLNEVSKIVRS